MTRYKIVITEFTTETKMCGREWRQGADPDNKDNGWGYTPQIEKDVEVEREILKQNLEDLDLTAVIKAVNGL